MIVDSSIFIALLQHEAEAEALLRCLAASNDSKISAPNYLEARMIALSRGGEAELFDLERLVALYDVRVVAFTPKQAALATFAFQQFGKGRHPAGLNFGDCMSYALAKDMGEPLLFKGDDFSKTDVDVMGF